MTDINVLELVGQKSTLQDKNFIEKSDNIFITL